MEEDSGIDIIDVENYKSEQQQQFSHSLLVMSVMNKCREAGCKEMRSGYFNEKMDKFGNLIKIYIEDTRKAFIESVKSCEMFMVCDYDKEATDNIDKIKKELSETYKTLCIEEEKEWNKLTEYQRNQHKEKQGLWFLKNALNIKLPYYQEYIEKELEAYREIFKELTKLTKRLYFYEAEVLSA